MEAFSDAVIAIALTIMVLEFKVPAGHRLADLLPIWPVALGYLISFVYLAIYWNNHHHMLHKVQHVSGSVLWANNHLLFWLSLVPFATAWATESHFAKGPMMLYGIILLGAGTAYWILTRALVSVHGHDSEFTSSLGNNRKEYASIALYLLAIFSSLFNEWVAGLLYVAVAIMWLVPDRRFAQTEKKSHG